MAWIQTHSGKRFDLHNPKPEQICIEDIAHSLSLQCRYTGHCNFFYSVAQHSVILSRHVPPERSVSLSDETAVELALDALLHDAHEAYTSDLASPTKRLLPDYIVFEGRIERAVRARFGLPERMSPTVRMRDQQLCRTEMLALFDDELDWSFVFKPLDVLIAPWPARASEIKFLQRFEELMDERAK